jgi:hypothetical protein
VGSEDDDDIEAGSDNDFAASEKRRGDAENRGEEDEEEEEDEKRKSPYAANGFCGANGQPLFAPAFAAAMAATGKPPLDGLLLPHAAMSPQEYLARYYHIMQQQQGQSAAAALSAAVAASTAKMGSPALHRGFDSGIEQPSN